MFRVGQHDQKMVDHTASVCSLSPPKSSIQNYLEDHETAVKRNTPPTEGTPTGCFPEYHHKKLWRCLHLVVEVYCMLAIQDETLMIDGNVRPYTPCLRLSPTGAMEVSYWPQANYGTGSLQ